MPRRLLLSLLAILIVGSTVGAEGWAAQTAEKTETVLVVELLDRHALRLLRNDLREYSVSIRSLGRMAPGHYETERGVVEARDVRRWAAVAASDTDVGALQQFLQQLAYVRQVTVEKKYTAALLPNDARFAEQYALQSAQALADINAVAAWDRTTGSSSTVIAIIDGGVDITHEDLASKIWVNTDEVAGNGVDDDGNGYVDDVHGWDFVSEAPTGIAAHHATHVAGIAAASGNNGVGIAGVDWEARIMSVRVLHSNGLGGEAEIVQGIEYAVANGADVINMSIVGPPSAALSAAIENAYAAGVVVVAAAGNNGSDTGVSNPQPACADQGGINMVLGVGATDESGEPASFSSYGECLDVSAPGRRIMSARTTNKYGEMTGTSMSAPFVSGVVGLYVALHPEASAAEAIAAVVEGRAAFVGSDESETVSWNTRYKGMLDAAASLAGESVAVETSPAPEQSGSSGGDSGGGGGGGGGGGEEVVVSPKPRVAGAISSKANLALLKRVKLTFNYVFGRYPTPGERLYWDTRVKKGEKRTYEALLGAMQWQRTKGWTAGPKK